MPSLLKTDCRWYKGTIPCSPHKEHGVHCVEASGAPCRFYDPVDGEILIIKLGALGDVIRTTPLLHRLKREHPHARITWVTHNPEILPPSVVDRRLEWTLATLTILRSSRFDLLINLDKDLEACALCDQVQAAVKRGFILRDGVVSPIEGAAEHKLLTGVFDDVSQANVKSYPQEIFEICGYSFNAERYILDRPAVQHAWKLARGKPVIGLNTGCGDRWTSRLWADDNWISLAKALKRKGYEVILLGGQQEHAKNTKLARAARVKYFGHFPLMRFLDLVDQCDLVVTGVTMAMHIAIGLGKKIVLINNIFNRHEFELYGQGLIIEPERPCQCYYRPTCVNSQYQCMDFIRVPQILEACQSLVPPPQPRTRSRR